MAILLKLRMKIYRYGLLLISFFASILILDAKEKEPGLPGLLDEKILTCELPAGQIDDMVSFLKEMNVNKSMITCLCLCDPDQDFHEETTKYMQQAMKKDGFDHFPSFFKQYISSFSAILQQSKINEQSEKRDQEEDVFLINSCLVDRFFREKARFSLIDHEILCSISIRRTIFQITWNQDERIRPFVEILEKQQFQPADIERIVKTSTRKTQSFDYLKHVDQKELNSRILEPLAWLYQKNPPPASPERTLILDYFKNVYLALYSQNNGSPEPFFAEETYAVDQSLLPSEMKELLSGLQQAAIALEKGDDESGQLELAFFNALGKLNDYTISKTNMTYDDFSIICHNKTNIYIQLRAGEIAKQLNLPKTSSYSRLYFSQLSVSDHQQFIDHATQMIQNALNNNLIDETY